MDNVYFKVSKAFEKDGTKHLIGCISSTSRDLQGEIFPPDVLKSMAESAVGIPLSTTHKRSPYGMDDIGVVEKAWTDETGKILFADFKLDDDNRANKLYQAVERGTTVGFSVGGEGKTFNRIYKEFTFDHIIPTDLPANPDTELYTKAVAKSFDDITNLNNLNIINIEELSVDVCKALDKSVEMEITDMDKDTEVEVVAKAGKKHSAATVAALQAVKEAPDMDTAKSMIDDLLNGGDMSDDDDTEAAPSDAIVSPVVPGPSGDPVDDANPPSEADDILNPVIKEQIDVSVAKLVAELLPQEVEKEVSKRIADYKSAIEKIASEVKEVVAKSRTPKEGETVTKEAEEASLGPTTKDAILVKMLQRLNK